MSLARIPFTQEDEGIIRSLGGWMLFIAILHFIGGGLFGICGCCGAFGAVAQLATLGLSGIVLMLQVLLLVLLSAAWIGQGVLMVQARTAFRGVADTDHADQQFLAEAFKKMKSVFMVEVILGILYLVLNIVTLVNNLVSDVNPAMMMNQGQGFGGMGGGM